MKRKRGKLLLLVLVSVYLLSGCKLIDRYTSTPEKTVYGFVDALNDSDVNKALDYILPSQSKGFKGMFSIASKFLGFDLSDLLDMAPFLSDVADLDYGKIDLDYEITDIQLDGDEEEAWVTGTDYNSGEEITFHLEKDDGIWYIDIKELGNRG